MRHSQPATSTARFPLPAPWRAGLRQNLPAAEPLAVALRATEAGPALALLLLCFACAPTPVEVHASVRFTGAAATSALAAALPPAVLASLGGSVPDRWPAEAPPLLLTLTLVQRARLDFTGSGALSPSQVSALRVLGVTAQVQPGPTGPLAPDPAELLIFAAPYDATSLADHRVRPLARGAWPLCSSCAATRADGGVVTGAPQALPLEPGGAGALAELLKANDKLALFVALRVPLDSRKDPRRPRAAATIDLALDLELVP